MSSLGIGTEANWDGAAARARAASARSPSSTRRSSPRGSRARSRASIRCSSSRRKTSRRWTSSSSTRSPRRSSRWTTRGWTMTPRERAARRRVHRLGHRRVHAPSSASTRRCSRAARARSRRSSFPSAIINLAAGQVSIRFGAKGPNSATCTACSASAHAIGDAFEIIRRGDADVMIAGGSEAAITPMGVGGFGAHARAVDAQRRAASAPAGRSTRTATASSSAKAPASLILEELRARAGARRARSTPSSSATACRPTRTTSPRRPRTATAPCRVMDAALESAGIAPPTGRLHQRARHLDAARRQARDAGDQALLRRPRATSWRCRRPSR